MNIFEKSFSQLQGQFCWGIRWGSYINLRLSFGNPHLKVKEIHKNDKKYGKNKLERFILINGDWELTIDSAYWRMSMKGAPLASSSSTQVKKNRAIAEIRGQKFSVVEMGLNGRTKFKFDLGGELEVWRVARESRERLWSLYKPNGYVLTVRGNGEIEHSKSSAPFRG